MAKDESAETLGEKDEAREGQQVVFRMPTPLYRRVRDAADEEFLMLSEYMRKVLRAAIEMTECEECGEDVPGDARFCPYCKTEFEDPESEDEDKESEKED